ncbi:helix-turn-helix domain-containing protein [Actinomadura flavalba]|uniref:helix-turn-helix domain-containing protein n=1 Tax=Actinomadura flavalba TaxID=1120938 RepID=UPI000377F40B|nr:helix-turn-helix transcriptional regulator [Actinomadura flavalba]
MVGAIRLNSLDLGPALRELRLASARQANSVARGASMSKSKLSKIENGRVQPSVVDVDLILKVLDVPDEIRMEFLNAARAAVTEATAWRLYRRLGFHKHQQEIRAVEAGTRLLRLFQPSVVPGLLQTRAYIRRMLERFALSPDVLAGSIAARLERQATLCAQDREFRFLITESVLRWEMLPPVMMAEQLDRLISVSRLSNVSLSVLPMGGPKPDAPTSAFVIFDRRLVTIEIPHAEITTRDPQDIQLYLQKFAGFEQIAVTGEAMRNLVQDIRDETLRERETS